MSTREPQRATPASKWFEFCSSIRVGNYKSSSHTLVKAQQKIEFSWPHSFPPPETGFTLHTGCLPQTNAQFYVWIYLTFVFPFSDISAVYLRISQSGDNNLRPTRIRPHAKCPRLIAWNLSDPGLDWSCSQTGTRQISEVQMCPCRRNTYFSQWLASIFYMFHMVFQQMLILIPLFVFPFVRDTCPQNLDIFALHWTFLNREGHITLHVRQPTLILADAFGTRHVDSGLVNPKEIRGCIQPLRELSCSRLAWKDTGDWFKTTDSFLVLSADWPIGFTGEHDDSYYGWTEPRMAESWQ